MEVILQLVHSVPTSAIFPVCLFGFTIPAMIGLWLVHENIHERLRVGETLLDNGVVGWFFSGILTIYGITLGLIAVSTWETSSEVADLASREAATIAALYRDAGGFPPPLKEELRGKLGEYIHFVIDKEWPSQRIGQILTDGRIILNGFQSPLYSNEPASEGQRILQAEAIRKFNELIELRRQRWQAVDQSVPKEIWLVVLLGGMLTIATSFCFQVQQFRFHLILTTGLAAMIGLLVFLIAALDQPYRGAMSVDSKAYQLVLDTAMKDEK